MVRIRTRRVTGDKVRFSPPLWEGLDLFTHESLLNENAARALTNCRFANRALSRRLGARKVAKLTDPGAAITFGTDAKFAAVTAASQLVVPAGGFAVRWSFVVTHAGASNTAFLISSRVTGQSYHVFNATMSDAGVLIVTFYKESDKSAVSITTSALTAATTQHALAIFDAPAGTFTLYLNGVSVGTPVTGIAVTEKPVQASTDWYFGVHWNPSAGPAAVVADTHYDGAMDGFCLLTLAGTRPTSGTPTLVSELIRDSLRLWPVPQSRMVLACYDFNDASGTALTDRSRFKNDGVLNGTPTLGGTALALPAVVGQHCGLFEEADGTRTNVVAAGGAMHYETVRAATP